MKIVRNLDVKYLLDTKLDLYNTSSYIESDPISIPHRFSLKQDVEIAAFLSATIAWGNRKAILKNASYLMDLMENTPYDFVLNASESDLSELNSFVHRTFNGQDCVYFIRALRQLYRSYPDLESLFFEGYSLDQTVFSALAHFRKSFFFDDSNLHVRKHISDVHANSAAKRLNMFLKWMVRKDEAMVDLGIWQSIPMSALLIPLDVHVGDVSRALGLLQRKQNDWKALEELMAVLRSFDPYDPVKYDFALFGMGVFENKKNLLL